MAEYELLDVVVIGGSQAGLAMAWHLARQHLRFVVLEAGPEPGHTWRSRWDSLTLFAPAQYAALPGMPFPGPPDTYPTKEQVADYLNAYAAEFDLPVKVNARVTALIPACTFSACPGSTAAARPCSASSTKTPPAW